ncbi:hypothetical protein BDW02DRAFT_68353 [Decorospora gaudefroyi]|uniref:Uncharacterized protein n=1 Tax=Decorospora gaudefroyi TaxID=184978 RepID=A0A6A5KPD0_9PLEO|nr:hypothetical protein BDW02DRAFT_68353 [Decorospora gaudefroyi]
MTSKRIFSWSKRQSASEPYYRTGGLLPIETNDIGSSNDFEAETSPNSGRRRPSNLTIATPENKQYVSSPTSAQYNAVLVSAANSLQAVFNDMLRSPVPSAAACSRSTSVQKPLPSRPRSASVPSTPELPVELPGSLLLENQGFPSCTTPVSSRPVTQIFRRETHPFDKHAEVEIDPLDPPNFTPAPLTHARSVPDLSVRHSTMRSVRSGNALNTSTTPKPSPLKVQHKKSLSDTSSRRRSKPNLVSSPLSFDSRSAKCSRTVSTTKDSRSDPVGAQVDGGRPLQPAPLLTEERSRNPNWGGRRNYREEVGSSSTPTPTTTRSKHVEELKATIATQDQTISVLQTQFSSLRASHEAHIASLRDSHSAEVASLKNYIQVLEEQSSKRGLHHASSNNFLFLLDTTEPPQTPTQESSQNPSGPESASSITSFQSALEKQQRSPQRLRSSPDMENLKRKLSTTRRPETTTRNLLPELNQYKQNNVALQKQIESLMAKLNDSKRNERELRSTLGMTEQRCAELEDKAGHTDQLAKTTQALQNTIDHLESRLEIANIERLDAEEQLFNLRDAKSPFDAALSKVQVPSLVDHGERQAARNAHMSMSTVFSDASPMSPEVDSQENSTLAVFVAHIERLQDQVREKDGYIAELEEAQEHLREQLDQLEHEHNKLGLQSDIQTELLRKTRRTDTQIERLRTAIIEREAIIGEKDKAIRAVQRQLEYHKLLLQAEIRRHAAMKLHAAAEDEPLPELTSLAKREDIDRWISKLNERLKKENSTSEADTSADGPEAQMENLRQEVSFYVREIILFKLDIKGYKSDIRKLKRITAQLSSYGRASDMDSEASSLRPLATPVRSGVASATPELGPSTTTSPLLGGPAIMSTSVERPVTPSPSVPVQRSNITPSRRTKSSGDRGVPQRLGLDIPTTPQTPTYKDFRGMLNEADRIDSGISPRSVAPLSSERRRPTPSSPNHDGLMKSSPLRNPTDPQRCLVRKRSMSESALDLFRAPRTPEWSIAVQRDGTASNRKAVMIRGRSASASDAGTQRDTPERPARPRYGLFDTSAASISAIAHSANTQQLSTLVEETGCFPDARTPPDVSIQQRSNSNSSTVRGAPPSLMLDIRERAGSAASHTSNNRTQSAHVPERKLSAASNSSTPFVIAMGSPHNPALIAPSAAVLPTICSITRNAPLKITPPTSRTGVGGTMASSTPVTSPVSRTDAVALEPVSRPTSTRPSHTARTTTVRKTSLRSKSRDDQVTSPPRTPSHLRTASESSIRTAIRIPRCRDKEKEQELHRMRKDSISMPKPLGSPFGIERSTSVGRNQDHEKHNMVVGYAYDVGEAI